MPTNATAEELAMTAPVKTGTKADRTETSVTMAFYLPSAYTLETAPVPTNSSVRLVTEPKRTLGIVSFSWYATRRRTERAAADLDDTLAEKREVGHGAGRSVLEMETDLDPASGEGCGAEHPVREQDQPQRRRRGELGEGERDQHHRGPAQHQRQACPAGI